MKRMWVARFVYWLVNPFGVQRQEYYKIDWVDAKDNDKDGIADVFIFE